MVILRFLIQTTDQAIPQSLIPIRNSLLSPILQLPLPLNFTLQEPE